MKKIGSYVIMIVFIMVGIIAVKFAVKKVAPDSAVDNIVNMA